MPPAEEFLHIQQEVFEDTIKSQHAEGAELNFIAENGLPFRLFSEQLHDDERDAWVRYANGDNTALLALEAAYLRFKQDLLTRLADSAPDRAALLSEAIARGDVDAASDIIATFTATPESTMPTPPTEGSSQRAQEAQ